MNLNLTKCVAAVWSLAIMAMPSQTGGATLKVGDRAPKLVVSRWVQGEPVKEFARDKAYIVEFWATWCGPCRASIPHLNELHLKYKNKGLVVIGQDVWEQDTNLVEPFIKSMGDKMTYRVALDATADGDKGTMAETWMEAAGQDGIPAAFLVDKRGSIAWIGHPMKLKESVLEQVLDGTYDLPQAAADYARRQKTEEELKPLWKELNQRMQKEDWDQAEKTLAQIDTLLPEDERDDLGTRRFEVLLGRKDYAAAYKLAAAISASHQDDAMLQNQLAWQIATKDGIEKRDLDLAEKIARRANDAAKGSDADILDTLARVLFLKGEKESAIGFQQKAVTLAEGRRKSQFQKSLDDYKKGQLPSEQRMNTLRREFSRSMQNKEWDKAESALAELETLADEEDRPQLGLQRFRMLMARKDFKGAYALAEKLSDTYPKNEMLQNELSWEIVTLDGVEERNLDVAEKIARHANDAGKGNNAEVLDTLARVLFMKGQKDEAISAQEKAVDAAKGTRKSQFQATLDSYKKGALPKPY